MPRSLQRLRALNAASVGKQGAAADEAALPKNATGKTLTRALQQAQLPLGEIQAIGVHAGLVVWLTVVVFRVSHESLDRTRNSFPILVDADAIVTARLCVQEQSGEGRDDRS